MSDDGEDILRRHNARGGGDHVSQQRLAGNLVQHLGMTRLQPRSFTGGEDGDSEGRRVWHWWRYNQVCEAHPYARAPSVESEVTVVRARPRARGALPS